MADFKLYRDKELKELAEDPIDLGKVKAGQSKKFTFYVLNASVHPYEEMLFDVDHAEVKVISAPEELKEKQSAEITFEWNPKVNIRRGLKTSLKIEGYQVIG